jgi:hypothetical protein
MLKQTRPNKQTKKNHMYFVQHLSITETFFFGFEALCLRKLLMPSEYIARALALHNIKFLKFNASDSSINDLFLAKPSFHDSSPDK